MVHPSYQFLTRSCLHHAAGSQEHTQVTSRPRTRSWSSLSFQISMVSDQPFYYFVYQPELRVHCINARMIHDNMFMISRTHKLCLAGLGNRTGGFVLEVHPSWAPVAVNRFQELVLLRLTLSTFYASEWRFSPSSHTHVGYNAQTHKSYSWCTGANKLLQGHALLHHKKYPHFSFWLGCWCWQNRCMD